MSSADRAVTYDDGIPLTTAGQGAPYPEALLPVSPVLAELRDDKIADPGYFKANIGLFLDLILGLFRGFHETHREAQRIHAAYRSEKEQYCVYLRSFALAGTVLSTHLEGPGPGQTLGYSAVDRYFREFVRSALPADFESVSFINTLDLYPSNAESEESVGHMRRVTIPSFRLLNHNWRDVVREVIRGANFVVLNAGFATSGVAYELELLRECDMAKRTIVATSSDTGEIDLSDAGAFDDVIDFGIVGGGLAERPSARLAERIRSLAGDGRRQVNDVEDLSDMRCWVVDRQIDLAVLDFGEEFLRGIPYDQYIPSSLAPAWSMLTELFPKMNDEWREAEAGLARGDQPEVSILARILDRAMEVFYLATLLERYYEMAIALSTIGMAHRSITSETEIMVTCYRHAAQCSEWHGEPELATFLTGAYAQLRDEATTREAVNPVRQEP